MMITLSTRCAVVARLLVCRCSFWSAVHDMLQHVTSPSLQHSHDVPAVLDVTYLWRSCPTKRCGNLLLQAELEVVVFVEATKVLL